MLSISFGSFASSNMSTFNFSRPVYSGIKAYFYSWCDLYGNGKYSGKSGFVIRSLLHHMLEGHLYKELSDLLCDHNFIEATFEAKAEKALFDCYSMLLFNVLEKNQKLNREISYNDVYAFYDFVSRNFHIFHKQPKLIMQQALNEPPQSIVKLCKENLKACYIENLTGNEALSCRLATISGFVKNITASIGGKQASLVYLGSENGYLKILDLLTRKVIYNVKGHFASITSICYATKNRICTSSVDGTLCLWDSLEFSRIAVMKGHRHNVSGCCADPSGCILFSSGWDNSVRLWSLADGKSISEIEDFKCPVNCLDHHPLKQQIACGLWDGSIYLIDSISMKKKNIFQSSSGSVKSICYSPDGISILSCFMDSEIFVLSAEEGLKMSSLKGHILPVKSFSFSSDDDAFISGSEDCTLKVWSSSSKFDSSVIDECKSCSIGLMEFLSDTLLAVAFHNSEISIFDILSGKAVNKFSLAPDSVTCISKPSDSTFEDAGKSLNCLVIGTLAGKLMIGNLYSSQISVKHDMRAKITAILHNSDVILCGSADGDIGLFSFNNNIESKVVKGAHKSSITYFCLTCDDDSLFAISTSTDNVLKIWSFSKNFLEMSFDGALYNKHKDTITCLTYSKALKVSAKTVPPKPSFFSGSHDNNIILWNDKCEKVFQGLHSSIRSIACSADHVLGCSNDGAVIIWSLNGNVLSSFRGVESSSSSIAFFIAKGKSDPFDVLLAYVERDGSIKITKPLQRSFCHSLEGHLKPITSCCTTDNGEIISCSLDGSVNVWKLPADMKPKNSFHNSAVTGVIVSPSCEYVLSSDANGSVILWEIDVLSETLPLQYSATKNFAGGFIRSLSWLSNKSLICAVTQKCDSQEKYFLATLCLERNDNSGSKKNSLQVKNLQYFENEISCLDTCAKTGSVVFGTKSGDLTLISSGKQKTSKQSDEWLLGVGFLSVKEDSDHICAAFLNGCLKIFSVSDFLSVEDIQYPSTMHEIHNPDLLTSSLCSDMGSLIFCGDFEGRIISYAQATMKFSEKVHQDSISGICYVEDYLFTCSLDRTIKVWAVPSFKQVGQFHSQVPITCVAAQKNHSEEKSGHSFLAFGTSSGEVQLLKYYA